MHPAIRTMVERGARAAAEVAARYPGSRLERVDVEEEMISESIRIGWFLHTPNAPEGRTHRAGICLDRAILIQYADRYMQRLAYYRMLQDYAQRAYEYELGRLIEDRPRLTPIAPGRTYTYRPLPTDRLAMQAEMMERYAQLRREYPDMWRTMDFNAEQLHRTAVETMERYRQLREQQEQAEAKAMKLLDEQLSGEQRASLQKHGYFFVTGGTTGKRYKIKTGRAQNVFEMDGDQEIIGLCFMPMGAPSVGDSMLAQKLALECYEDEALGKANRFGGRYQNYPPMPPPVYVIFASLRYLTGA